MLIQILTWKCVEDRILNEKYKLLNCILQNNCLLSIKVYLPPSCFSISEIRMPVGFIAIISAVGQPADNVTVIDENSVMAGHGVSSLRYLHCRYNIA